MPHHDQRTSATAGGSTPPLDSGRRLRSGESAAVCLATLTDVVSSYRSRKYRHLPLVTDCGHVWLATSAPPQAVVCFTDDRDEFLAVSFWDLGNGTEIGVFPLGIGTDRLTMPLPGHWKMRDGSLSSIGTIPGGSLRLREPTVPAGYDVCLLHAVGCRATPSNLTATRELLRRQFLIKAHQFISSQNPAAADQFVARHQPAGDLQTIIRELGEWNPGVLPYIQDLPLRIWALMLEPETLRNSPFWAGIER